MAVYTSNPYIGSVYEAGKNSSQFGNQLSNMFSDTFSGTIEQLQDSARIDPNAWANKAGSDMADKFANMKAQGLRQASRMGVNPNSGRFAAISANFDRAAAAAESGASTDAWQNAYENSFDKLSKVAGIGLNLAGLANSANGQAGSLYGNAASLQAQQNSLLYDVDKNESMGNGYLAGLAASRAAYGRPTDYGSTSESLGLMNASYPAQVQSSKTGNAYSNNGRSGIGFSARQNQLNGDKGVAVRYL